jgi:hypothetical protein
MPKLLEADVALIHVASGKSMHSTPPGALAQAAPRRAARGRANDLYFINLTLHPDRAAAPGLTEHLTRLASKTYFRTLASITAGLREAAFSANVHLLDINQKVSHEEYLQGRMIAGVLRENDLYLAQSGFGQAILIRSGHVRRFSSKEADQHPLGITRSPHIRYFHTQVEPEDVLILTTTRPTIWSDASLAKISGLNPALAIEHLTPTASKDLSGLVIRIVSPGRSPKKYGEESQLSGAAPRKQAAEEQAQQKDAKREPLRIFQTLRNFGKRLGAAFSWIGETLTKGLARLAPGLQEPPPGTISPKLGAFTALAIPVLVVAIASAVYIQRGKVQLFQKYFSHAQEAIRSAETKETLEDAREDWENALYWLDTAGNYGTNEEYETLFERAENAVDKLNLVVRLDFRPAVSGGFGADADIRGLAATASELYVLGSANNQLWRAWYTGRGYEIDGDFQCPLNPPTDSDQQAPIDLALQPEPGALGVEGIVVISANGELTYCAPGRVPRKSQLTTPDIGWGEIQAVDVFGERLYILDPAMDAVWIYDASGGLFSGSPSLYFVDQVPDLHGAIDIAVTHENLLILYADGHLDRCRRLSETSANTGTQYRVECEFIVSFEDERPGQEATYRIPGALPIEMLYSPPPEPSIYFLDIQSSRVFHYSMRLVYQAQYLPTEPFDSELNALTVGPPNFIFVAADDQVYYAQWSR